MDGSFILIRVFSLCFFNQIPQPGTLKLSHIQEGRYIFQLTVTDTAGQRSSDNVSVTVLPMVHSAVGEKVTGAIACVDTQHMVIRASVLTEAEILFSIAPIHYIMSFLAALNCCFKVRQQANISCLLEQ